MATIEVQKLGFCIDFDKSDLNRISSDTWDDIKDALLDIEGVESVEGPGINACIGVIVRGDAKSIDKTRDAIVQAIKGLGINVT